MRTKVLEEVKKEIEKMLEAGFIRPCRYAEWISSIVPVQKKDGRWWVCVDFRDLNRATPKDEYLMPVAEMLINAATGKKILSFVDGNAGYNQIFMAPEDIHKTAFWVPGAMGLFEYVVMTFGLKNACTMYQRAMNYIYHDLIGKSIIQKLVYMRHRWFLPRKHKYRKMKLHFDNTVEKDSALKQYTGKLVFEMVKNIEVVFGKGAVKGQKRKKTPTLTYIPFKKQSIFFMYLPYWKDLQTCHNIDLMHVTKKVFDSIIGTLLDMSRKSKDGLKSHTNLVQFELRPELHPISRPNGKYFLPQLDSEFHGWQCRLQSDFHGPRRHTQDCILSTRCRGIVRIHINNWRENDILSMPTWGVSTNGFLIQHQQTSLNEWLVYVRLQFPWLPCDDDGFSRHCNMGHQIGAC
jgi:hypothetical protein